MTLSAIILAAGKATRMKSNIVKVMHPIAGVPMLTHVITACRQAGVKHILLVVGFDKQRVIDAYQNQPDITFVEQTEQKGTGHAAMVCKPAMEKIGLDGHVFVLGGDGPLIRDHTLLSMLDRHTQTAAAVTLATCILPNPTGYGRIVRDASQNLTGIVEQSDATPDQLKIQEVNATYWIFKTAELFSSLTHVKPNNAKGEYYLTDTLAVLKSQSKRLEAVPSVPPEDVYSINTRAELAVVQEVMQRRIQSALMASGVSIVSPANTFIEFDASIGQDTTLEPFTWIGSKAVVPPGSYVKAGTVLPPNAVYPG